MVSFVFKRGPVRVREMAFGSIKDTNCTKCDVVYMHSNDERPTPGGHSYIEQRQYTLLTDLTMDEESLFLLLNKNYRNEIRRAEREGVTNKQVSKYCEEIIMDLEEFKSTYNSMFRTKGMSNQYNTHLVNEGLKKGQILITIATDPNIRDCKIFHAYLCDDKSTVLMYSASTLWNNDDKQIKNAIGRMNKYLHWLDIKYFKNKGYTRYEWGGISSVENPNGIDKFKMEFGGTLKQYNNYIIAKSILGKLYIALLKAR